MSELGKSPRRFSNAFKERMVLRLEAGERIAAVAEEAGVKRKHSRSSRRPRGRGTRSSPDRARPA